MWWRQRRQRRRQKYNDMGKLQLRPPWSSPGLLEGVLFHVGIQISTRSNKITVLLYTYCNDQYNYQFMWFAEDLFLCKSVACGAFPPFFDPFAPKISCHRNVYHLKVYVVSQLNILTWQSPSWLVKTAYQLPYSCSQATTFLKCFVVLQFLVEFLSIHRS